MTADISPSTKSVGFWSGVLATVFSITYVVGQLAEWAGWLGSKGGPESMSTPLGIVVLLVVIMLVNATAITLAIARFRNMFSPSSWRGLMLCDPRRSL